MDRERQRNTLSDAERLDRLLSILRTLVEFDERFDFGSTWDRIILDAVHLVGAARGTVFLVDRERDLLLPRVWYGQPWGGAGKPRGYQRGEGVAGLVWQTGETVNVPNVLTDPRFRPSEDPAWSGKAGSLLCVPIRARERVIGAIAVDSPWTDAFHTANQELLTILARHVASAWEKAKLFQGLGDMRAAGEMLNRLGEGGDAARTLQHIVDRALQVVAAGAQTGGEATAVVFTYHPDHGFDLSSRVAAGDTTEGDMRVERPRPGGLGERAITERRRVISYEEADLGVDPAKQAIGTAAVVAYPLLVAEKPLGVLYVMLRDERHFSRQELLLLDNFVNQAALALYHNREISAANLNLARKVHELEQLRRADVLLSTRPTLNEALDEILHIALEMTGAPHGSFRLFERRATGTRPLRQPPASLSAEAAPSHTLPGFLRLIALSGAPLSRAVQVLPVDDTSVVGLAALRLQPLRINDLHQEPWSHIYQPLTDGDQMRSELAVPLVGAGGAIVGVLNLEHTCPNAFTDDDERLVSALATQAVIAIQEIKLLETMQELTEATLTHSTTELFDLAIARACDLIQAPLGAIWHLLPANPDEPTSSQVLVLQAASGGHQRGDKLPLENSLTGCAIIERRPVTVTDVQREPGFHFIELARQQGWRSALIVPLLVRQSTPIGAFSLYTTTVRNFSDWDKRLLTVLANHAAIAIRDAEQLANLRAAQERQAIAETFAAVGDVAANLLHRLNNQVGTIPVRIQGIEAKSAAALSDEYLAKNLRAIEASAYNAIGIVRDAMRHLRPIELAPVSLAQAVTQALDESHPPPEIRVTVLDLAQLPPVQAGAAQLTLVFLNLIENAVAALHRAGRTQGTITIQGRISDHNALITVRDDGPGIPPDLLPHIFELSVSTGQANHKLGFGLWWVKTLLTRSGGAITVESTPGHGTAFTLRLPLWQG
jgi:GAF domain-containing protein